MFGLTLLELSKKTDEQFAASFADRMQALKNDELKSKLKKLEDDFSNRIEILEAMILKNQAGK